MKSQHTFSTMPLAAVLVLALWAEPGWAQTLYGVTHQTGASELRSIDPVSGSSAAVIGLGLDAVVAPTATVSIPGNTVYVAGQVAGGNTLAIVNPAGPSLVLRPIDRAFANLHARADGQLVGLAANGATWEVRTLDPATGTSAPLGALPQLGWIVPSASAHRPGVAIYQVGRSVLDPSTPRLFVVDPATGAEISAAALSREFHSLHVRNDGTLIGLGWNGSAEALHTIDAATGASVAYRTFPAFGVLPPAASVGDRASGRIYQVGHASGPGDPSRLYSEDAASGPWSTNVSLTERYVALAHSTESLVSTPGGTVPRTLGLAMPRPNPFRGTTLIHFSLDRPRLVAIEIVDITGRIVRSTTPSALNAGEHTLTWAGDDAAGRQVPAGVYLVRMRAEDSQLVRRIIRIE